MSELATGGHSASSVTYYVGVGLYCLTFLLCGVYFVWSILSNRYRRGENNEIVMHAFIVDNLSKVFLCAFISCM
jgi:hypothetical protein